MNIQTKKNWLFCKEDEFKTPLTCHASMKAEKSNKLTSKFLFSITATQKLIITVRKYDISIPTSVQLAFTN